MTSRLGERAQLVGDPADGQTHFVRFLQEHLLLNGLSRPHFIAMEKTKTQELSFRAAVRFLHAVPILWTTTSEDEYYAHFDKGVDIQIFEGFLPPAFLLAGNTPDLQEDIFSAVDKTDSDITL